VITPRATRLVRVGDVQAFREAAIALAREGSPLDARDRIVIVPTRAAGAHLLRSLEDTMPAGAACLLPDILTPGEIVTAFAARLPMDRPVLTPPEREVLMGVACTLARDAGVEPPFQLRPGLLAAILAFYDDLRRHQHDIDTFARLTLAVFEPGAAHDRGAERLVRQTRFLVAAFREFERRVAEAGVDEHGWRRAVLATTAVRPVRHVVLTVTDRTVDTHGLAPADWDLLARVPRLERLDVLVTDRTLAGALHERLHHLLPGIEEVQLPPAAASTPPRLAVPSPASATYSSRDREEEVALFARRAKSLLRNGETTTLERIALVVQQPLPYVYIAREVLHAAGIPSQVFDALPLAAEPYAAALETIFACVTSRFARGPAIALLRSPQFRFQAADGNPLDAMEIAALDMALSEAGYLGDADAFDRLVEAWLVAGTVRLSPAARRAAEALHGAIRPLRPLCSARPVADHLESMLDFLATHDPGPSGDRPLDARQLRARGAILDTLAGLRDAHARFDPAATTFDETAALVRRWIDGQTFAPRTGDAGVHIVDAASAPFGRFEHVHLAGLVDGEWPRRSSHTILYSSSVLRDLGWPAESLRFDAARSTFADLLRLPSATVATSTFLLDADTLVTPSPLLDELEHAGLDRLEVPIPETRIFDYEALGLEPVIVPPPHAVRRSPRCDREDETTLGWIAFRTHTWDEASGTPVAAGTGAPARSLSALERYQDCPFRFFAADVLRLREAPADEDLLSPRARGRFLHEVFQRFFEEWDIRTGRATIVPERMDEARTIFAETAAPLLARLGEAQAALERVRLFGSAIAMGIVDTMLAIEAASPGEVRQRCLEYRFDGVFSLGLPDRAVRLTGVVDRIDLLADNRLRVVDYKTGAAPNPKRALQVPIYALCAQEMLSKQEGSAWQVDEASYVAFGGRRPLVRVVKQGGDADGPLMAARTRLFEAVDGIARAEFPARPHDPTMCRHCPYPSVCRKDYVADE
jgi:RecB family exonuclease